NRYGQIPPLTFKQKFLNEAKNFLQEHTKSTFPVTVHLKNNPKMPGCSNADFPAWQQFFEHCIHNYPATFFLIGNEPIPHNIQRLPNVVVTQNYNTSLVLDLS